MHVCGVPCVQVTEMKKVVQQKQVVVAQAKQDCEELLVEIVQDKRVADEQEKQVGSRSSAGASAGPLGAWCCVTVLDHPDLTATRTGPQHSAQRHTHTMQATCNQTWVAVVCPAQIPVHSVLGKQCLKLADSSIVTEL